MMKNTIGPILLKAQDKQLLMLRKSAQVIDTYASQLAELYMIKHPELIRVVPLEREGVIKQYIAKAGPLDQQGTWAYLPWQNSAIHLLPEKDFLAVRTNRNANIITPDEQKKFYDCVVGVAGLSVGGSIALTLALEGGARRIRIADFDRLELSNTNRILAGVHELDTPKTTIIARRIWEINPYAQVEIFDQGLNEGNIAQFMKGLDVVVDEMDSMAIKQLIREYARDHKIALVSTADNGDSSEVDVERHDQKRTPLFLGKLGKTSVEKFKGMNKIQVIQEITRLLGPENVPPRMQASVPLIGSSLVSVPQLGGTALMGAAATAYCIRRIAAGQPLPSGRTIISLDEKLEPGYATAKARAKRAKDTKAFAKRYGMEYNR